MQNCINLANIDSAVACSDYDNIGGLVQEIIYGYWDDVATWPELPAGTESAAIPLETAGKWNGDVTMKSGKCAYKMQFTDENGEFTMTDQGEIGGQSVLYQLDITKAKTNATILGFMNATRGRKMFIIVTDKNGNSYRMGDKLNAAKKIAADAVTTGRASTDLNRVPLRFTYVCPRNLIYDGDTTTLLTVTEKG